MFEKYTETARKSIFFARYEASQCGSPQIELEHLLAGILQSDAELALRLLRSPGKIQSIRDRIQKSFPVRQRISTSMDLPLNNACKRALAHAAEVAENLQHSHIHAAHLLLGVFRDEGSEAAGIMRENGLTEAALQEQVIRSAGSGAPSTPRPEAAEAPKGFRDLTAAASRGELAALIGRERELERVIQILSRRTRNNPVLVGETGVGKSAIVEGLARRIAGGTVPTLAERQMLAVDATTIIAPTQRVRSAERFEALMAEIASQPAAILCVDGLFDLAAAGSGWAAVEAAHVLERGLSAARMQCIATSTPAGLRQTMQKAPMLARHFEVVEVAPPNEEEAVRIVSSLKEQYERFHGVVFGDGVVEAAVHASGRFLLHRNLPDRALDLIDEAGARAKLRREKRNEAGVAAVGPDEIAEVVADRASVPVAAVNSALQQKQAGEFERIAQELTAVIPGEGQEWIALLTAYLARCPAEDAERLAEAIENISDRRNG